MTTTKPAAAAIVLQEINENEYRGGGFTMKREYGETPNGNKLNGSWVLRNEKGELLDFNMYRSDLAERFNLTLG